MKDWQECLASPELPIVDAMKIINSSRARIALVVDGEGRLRGAVTDGDIRRGLLRGLQVTAPVSAVANPNPLTAAPDTAKAQIRAMMDKAQIRQMPLVDGAGRVVGLFLDEEVGRHGARNRDVWVILMVGGEGKRLRPLTEDIPKPMLLVGGKPILETILEGLSEQGFHKFFLSVRYKAHAIRAHFGNGEKWGVDIQYLEEPDPLGTAGALSLVPERPPGPVIVMNGDLLTKIDFGHLVDFHRDQQAQATMAVREYDIQIEFGVVEIENDRIIGLKEKPVHQFLVNAGIYVLEPDSLGHVPAGQPTDMPTLFQRLIDDGRKCTVFPIVEYWLDIGRLSDFENAKNVIATL